MNVTVPGDATKEGSSPAWFWLIIGILLIAFVIYYVWGRRRKYW